MPDTSLHDQTPGVAAVADAILQARKQARPLDAQPFAASLRDAADAYAVQAIVGPTLSPAGATLPRHWKSGGPSRDTPLTHAPLPAAGVWTSPADARHWHCNERLIEAEIALRLARDVTPAQAAALSHDTAPALVDAMTVSIELVDSRWQQGTRAPALLKLADLQNHGALALGEWVPFEPRDWSRQACTVQIGSQPATHWQGTHALGDPAWLLPIWLRHATREGATVPAGTVVTTGTWCGALPAAAGDRVVARFDGVGEVTLQL